jgi:hypothetical protein
MKGLLEKLEKHLEDSDVDGRIIRKWVSKSRTSVCGADLAGSE